MKPATQTLEVKVARKRKKKGEKNKERREIYKWLCFWTIKIYTFLKANLFFILSGFMWVILSCVTEMVPTLKDRQRVNWNALSNCHFCNRDEIWLSATHLELQYQYPDAILPKPQSHYILNGVLPAWARGVVFGFVYLRLSIFPDLKANENIWDNIKRGQCN